MKLDSKRAAPLGTFMAMAKSKSHGLIASAGRQYPFTRTAEERKAKAAPSAASVAVKRKLTCFVNSNPPTS